MKAKPCRYGVKIWCLIDVKSKFVQKMEVYCGTCHEDAKHATRCKIVYGLMDGYKNQNHIVTCDNFFSNFALFWDLLEVGVHAIRTYIIDRNRWPSGLTIDPKRGSRG
jgi:hypothetical protein